MDKELPWLADNAQLELKYKKGKTPLSHRNWPGEPVPVITENIIQTLGDELLQKAEKKNIVWRYENFSLEWQSAITQAINLIGEYKPSITARTMAALACIAQNDSQQLLDEIVQQEGLEYATEVVIARQFIVRCYESDPLVVTLQYQNEDYGYGYRSETYNEFDLRLRKHLSGRGKLLAALRRQTHCRTARNNQSSPPFYCAEPPGKTRNRQRAGKP